MILLSTSSSVSLTWKAFCKSLGLTMVVLNFSGEEFSRRLLNVLIFTVLLPQDVLLGLHFLVGHECYVPILGFLNFWDLQLEKFIRHGLTQLVRFITLHDCYYRKCSIPRIYANTYFFSWSSWIRTNAPSITLL